MDYTWNSPGQNTGEWVAFPFSRASSQLIFPTQGINPRSSSLQVDSLPAEPQGKPKNTGVGSLSLLQGIFLTQGLNLGLLHCGQILYHLSHQGRSKVKVKVAQSCPILCMGLYSPWDSPGQNLEWVAFPFSRGSSQPRDRTQAFRIAGRFFTS